MRLSLPMTTYSITSANEKKKKIVLYQRSSSLYDAIIAVITALSYKD